MAYSVIKTEQGANGGNGYYTEYLCESVDDIATLPTEVEYGGPRPGSLALIETDGTVYILTNAREWSEFSMAGGGGGTSGGYDAVIRFNSADRGETWTGTLESGTFEAVQAKAEAGKMFSVGAYYRNENGTDMSIMAIGPLYYTNYVIAPLTGEVVFNASCMIPAFGAEFYLGCIWDSDGTITVGID